MSLAACSSGRASPPINQSSLSYNEARAIIAVQADFNEYFGQRRDSAASSWLDQHLADPSNYSVLVEPADSNYGEAVQVLLLPNLREPEREFRGGGLHCVVRIPAFERLFCARMK